MAKKQKKIEENNFDFDAYIKKIHNSIVRHVLKKIYNSITKIPNIYINEIIESFVTPNISDFFDSIKKNYYKYFNESDINVIIGIANNFFLSYNVYSDILNILKVLFINTNIVNINKKYIYDAFNATYKNIYKDLSSQFNNYIDSNLPDDLQEKYNTSSNNRKPYEYLKYDLFIYGLYSFYKSIHTNSDLTSILNFIKENPNFEEYPFPKKIVLLCHILHDIEIISDSDPLDLSTTAMNNRINSFIHSSSDTMLDDLINDYIYAVLFDIEVNYHVDSFHHHRESKDHNDTTHFTASDYVEKFLTDTIEKLHIFPVHKITFLENNNTSFVRLFYNKDIHDISTTLSTVRTSTFSDEDFYNIMLPFLTTIYVTRKSPKKNTGSDKSCLHDFNRGNPYKLYPKEPEFLNAFEDFSAIDPDDIIDDISFEAFRILYDFLTKYKQFSEYSYSNHFVHVLSDFFFFLCTVQNNPFSISEHTPSENKKDLSLKNAQDSSSKDEQDPSSENAQDSSSENEQDPSSENTQDSSSKDEQDPSSKNTQDPLYRIIISTYLIRKYSDFKFKIELKEQYKDQPSRFPKNQAAHNITEYLLCKIRHWLTYCCHSDSIPEKLEQEREFYEINEPEGISWEILYDSISDKSLMNKIFDQITKNKKIPNLKDFELWKNAINSSYDIYKTRCMDIFKNFITYERNTTLNNDSSLRNINTYTENSKQHFKLIEQVIKSLTNLIDFEESNHIWKQFDDIDD